MRKLSVHGSNEWKFCYIVKLKHVINKPDLDPLVITEAHKTASHGFPTHSASLLLVHTWNQQKSRIENKQKKKEQKAQVILRCNIYEKLYN